MEEDVLTTLKILIIGESGVGKSRYDCFMSTIFIVLMDLIKWINSSLLLRFTEDSFNPDQSLTIGVDFKTKKLSIEGNTVRLAIWVSWP